MPRRTALLALLAAVLAGCGGDAAEPPAPPPPSRSAQPELASRPTAEGEIVVRGEASPGSHGPYDFRGRYTVRFEQFAPEDPELDFSQETSFIAMVGSTRLFKAAARSGRKRITLNGRHAVDVEWGDFPYVIRFTPAPRSG